MTLRRHTLVSSARLFMEAIHPIQRYFSKITLPSTTSPKGWSIIIIIRPKLWSCLQTHGPRCIGNFESMRLLMEGKIGSPLHLSIFADSTTHPMSLPSFPLLLIIISQKIVLQHYTCSWACVFDFGSMGLQMKGEIGNPLHLYIFADSTTHPRPSPSFFYSPSNHFPNRFATWHTIS